MKEVKVVVGDLEIGLSEDDVNELLEVFGLWESGDDLPPKVQEISDAICE